LVGSGAAPVSAEDDRPGVKVYQGSDRTRITTDHPFTQAAMEYLLRAWPRVLPFGELVREVRTGGSVPGATDRDVGLLAANLLQAFVTSPALVSLHSYAAPAADRVSAQPVASASARMEAASRTTVTSLRHERIGLNDLRRWILLRLDGKHRRADLLEALLRASQSGALKFNPGEGKVATAMRDVLERELDAALSFFVNTALLEG
jgi:methyltransferase-like protein